jgi:hypothetical protein
MQLRKAMFAALFVAASGLVVGCGEEGGGGETACSDNSQCAATEICHPTADVCVTKCTGAADCPDTSKTCGTITVDGQESESFCQCQTDQLCGGGLGSSTVCSDSEDKICAVQCSEGTCGEGRTCNEQGHCVTDAGVDPGATCENTATEPNACAYGSFCSGDTGTGTCTAVAAPTCPNFTGGAHGKAWDPETSNGAVIYSISTVSVTNDPGFCGGSTAPTRYRVRVQAYKTLGTFTDTDEGIRGELHYVLANGNEGTTPMLQARSVTNGGQHAQFDLNFCEGPSSGQLTLGLHFQDGNEFCFVSDNPAQLMLVQNR